MKRLFQIMFCASLLTVMGMSLTGCDDFPKWHDNFLSPQLNVEEASMTVRVGQTQRCNVSSIMIAKLLYTSSDEKIATVDEHGLVTGVSEGEAVITVVATNMEDGKLIKEESAFIDVKVLSNIRKYDSDDVRPLTFEAAENNITVMLKFKEGAKPNYEKVDYSFDGYTWTALTSPTQPILLQKSGDIVMFRGDNPTYSGEAQFVVEGFASVSAVTRLSQNEPALAYISGNLHSLLKKEPENYTTTELLSKNKDAFKMLFMGAKTDVKKGDNGEILLKLPTILAEGAFAQTFANSHITALELPAKTLQKGCYIEICLGCEYLEKINMLAEELPNNVKVDECLKDMFKDAGGKTEGSAPELNVPVPKEVGSNPSLRVLSINDILAVSGINQNVHINIIDKDGKTQEFILGENVSIKEGCQSLTVKVGAQLDLSQYIVVTPDEAMDKSIRWSSADQKIAAVDETSGVVTALSAGTVRISGVLYACKYSNDNPGPNGETDSVVIMLTIEDDTPTPTPEPEPEPEPEPTPTPEPEPTPTPEPEPTPTPEPEPTPTPEPEPTPTPEPEPTPTPPTPAEGQIMFTNNGVSKTWSATAADNTYTQAASVTGDAVPTYSISDNSCGATIDSTTGKVTFTKAGSVKVTATVEDTEAYTYATKSVSYILTVNNPGFDPLDPYGSGGDPLN